MVLAGPALANGGAGGGAMDGSLNLIAGGADNPTAPGGTGMAGRDTGIGASGAGGAHGEAKGRPGAGTDPRR